MARPARRRREIEHVRSDILHAAARAFGRLGIENATLHDIARQAGYTTTSLYAYFKGKQEIIDALFAAIRSDFGKAFDCRPPVGLSFAQKLEFLFARLAEAADRWPEATTLAIEARRTAANRSLEEAVWAKDDPFLRSLTGWLKTHASPDDRGGHQAGDVACLIRGAIVGVSFVAEPEDSPLTSHDRFALALQFCLYGIGGARRAPVPDSTTASSRIRQNKRGRPA